MCIGWVPYMADADDDKGGNVGGRGAADDPGGGTYDIGRGDKMGRRWVRGTDSSEEERPA